MAQYNFTAKDKTGNLIKNSLQAASRYEAMEALKKKDLILISLSSHSDEKKSKKQIPKIIIHEKGMATETGKIRPNDISVFCRQLSTCINAGIPLLESLNVIAEGTSHYELRSVVLDVAHSIKDGKHFSEALAKHKKVFDPLFVAIIKSSEESGSIPQALEHLSSSLEKNVRLIRKIRSITAYPMFVTGFFCVIIAIVTLFVIPKFEVIYTGLGSNLPLITKIVFQVNSFIIKNIFFFVLVIIASFFAILIYARSQTGAYHLDRAKLKLPVIGSLIMKYTIARFCRYMAMMIRGGVSIVKSFEISSDIIGNRVLGNAIKSAKSHVIEGSDITSSLKRSGIFPNIVIKMVGIGEAAGKLPDVMDKISDMYEDEVDGTVMVLTSLFEPVIIVLFGALVLILIFAIYVPVFRMAMSIKY